MERHRQYPILTSHSPISGSSLCPTSSEISSFTEGSFHESPASRGGGGGLDHHADSPTSAEIPHVEPINLTQASSCSVICRIVVVVGCVELGAVGGSSENPRDLSRRVCFQRHLDKQVARVRRNCNVALALHPPSTLFPHTTNTIEEFDGHSRANAGEQLCCWAQRHGLRLDGYTADYYNPQVSGG
jgi:hypothetical protein